MAYKKSYTFPIILWISPFLSAESTINYNSAVLLSKILLHTVTSDTENDIKIKISIAEAILNILDWKETDLSEDIKFKSYTQI